MASEMDFAASQYHQESTQDLQEQQPIYDGSGDGIEMPSAPEQQTGASMSNELQTIIAELNEKRSRDSKLLENFKAALEMRAHETYTMVEEKMYSVYEEQSALVQSEIDELSAVLQRISYLEAEFAHFQQGLHAFYQGLTSESFPSQFH